MKKITRKLFSYVMQGLLTVLPLLITIYVFKILFNFFIQSVDGILVFIPMRYRAISYVPPLVEIAAGLSLVFLITVFGLIVKTIFGKKIIKTIDSLANSIPLINSIYRTTRKLMDLIILRKERSLMLSPVFVEYPSPGIWAVAFITNKTETFISGSGEKHFSVFIPTTPNPTSGFLVFIAENKIKTTNFSVEEAVQLILSGGMLRH
jgi:uncharacterized membrane protein